MKKWLRQHKEHIPNQDIILCSTGIPIIATNDADFLCLSIDIILSIAFGSVLLLILMGYLVRLNWTHIQILLIAKFNKFNIHCFRKTGPAGSVVEHPLRDREVVGSNPGRAIPKALKMVPVATLLGAQHYKASTGFSSPNKQSHN